MGTERRVLPEETAEGSDRGSGRSLDLGATRTLFGVATEGKNQVNALFLSSLVYLNRE